MKNPVAAFALAAALATTVAPVPALAQGSPTQHTLLHGGVPHAPAGPVAHVPQQHLYYTITYPPQQNDSAGDWAASALPYCSYPGQAGCFNLPPQ
jgi:hypothetical protein